MLVLLKITGRLRDRVDLRRASPVIVAVKEFFAILLDSERAMLCLIVFIHSEQDPCGLKNCL